MRKNLSYVIALLSLFGSACAVSAEPDENAASVALAARNNGTDITTRDECLSGCAESLEYCISNNQSLPPGETCESKSRDCVDYCYDVFEAITRANLPRVIVNASSVSAR